MTNYRSRFLFALAGNLLLVAAIAALWWHHRTPEQPMAGQTQAVAAQVSTDSSAAPPPASQDAPLVPIQISPQRLQSIGVKTDEVQRKLLDEEIHTTGNVAVDETKLAYVQVRYSGYIQKVFIDATYQHVRKGQPLFTIYSPDLVATEREYLVARQNQQQVSQSTVPGVTSGAASLLDATAERLRQWGVPPQEISRLESTGEVQQELEVSSPV